MLSDCSTTRLWRLALIGATLSGLGAAGAAAADLKPAWSALATGRPEAALRLVDRAGSSRAERLAWAAATMNAQPATEGGLRGAEQVLADLSQGRDPITAEAAYLRARLYQLYFSQPDYPRAAQLYRDLAASQPESHWAQLGLVKLGLLKLYVLPDAAAGGDRLAGAEAILAEIREPALRRDLELQIGRAGIVLKQPLARLLPHLIAADRIGGIPGTAHEDLLVQLGVLSLRAGLAAQAKGYFQRYLHEYPDNVRAFTIHQKLIEAERQLAQGDHR